MTVARPYCDHENEVNMDDGHGYDESVCYEEECRSCGKNFVMTAYISVHHTGHKAECLNGADHDLQFLRSYPQEFSRMVCKDCDFERKAEPHEHL